MNWRSGIIYLVDDDPRVCDAMQELLAANQYRCITFASIGLYTSHQHEEGNACLILDIELPDVNGLDFQRGLAGMHHPPIIFVTGHGDIPSSVRAIKDGAVDFLTKPVIEAELLAAVEAALERDRIQGTVRDELAVLEARLASLTPRERQVLPLVVSGLMNKQAAAELGISEITLQIHRSKILKKMKATSLPDLVRMAEKLKIPITHSRHPGHS